MDRNDLISREDLKIELTKQIAYFGERAHTQSDENEIIAYSRCKDGLLLARQIVDNAPTNNPEITEKQAILFLINSGWIVNHDKELREKWKRPQGNWNYLRTGMCICPFCGAMPHTFYKNYCAKCGADLRQDNKPDRQITIEEYMQSLKGENQ